MRTIAVVNQKGGCGKTTTCINLAAFLAREHRRTLVVDMDPQGHATLGLLLDPVEPSRSMSEALLRQARGRDILLRDITVSVHENLDVAPTNILLSAVPETLGGVSGRENILSELLCDVRHDYDYVVVDCPPHVGLLTFNALKACSEAIIPLDPSFFSLHGIGKMLETLDVLAQHSGHEIVPRALVTLFSGRTQFARNVVDEIRKHLCGRYFNTVIRHSVKLAEAASHGLPIAHYCTHCAGFEDYEALTAEVLQMEARMLSSEPVMAVVNEHEDLPGPSAPKALRDGVIFTIEAPEAQRVQLVGDFNGWMLDGSEMKPAGRIWSTVLKLRPGRYRYRYVVDGHWQSDPLNADVEPAPYGGHNSVFVLDEHVAE